MLKMMIAFFKDFFKYRPRIKKQKEWMQKFIAKKGYALNPDWMMSTNLSIWLTEMEDTFGKRYCPCFEPSGDVDLDKKMLCPCKFIDDEIEEYGTCHCALFGAADLDAAGWKASSKRLQAEYRIPLNLQQAGVLDTRGVPLDKRRNLPVPDAMHQLKNTLNNYTDDELTMLVEREQEVINLGKIAEYRGFDYESETLDDHYAVKLKLKA
jgi:ferredoxin-thioredoxin reductase catalytic subunit